MKASGFRKNASVAASQTMKKPRRQSAARLDKSNYELYFIMLIFWAFM